MTFIGFGVIVHRRRKRRTGSIVAKIPFVRGCGGAGVGERDGFQILRRGGDRAYGGVSEVGQEGQFGVVGELIRGARTDIAHPHGVPCVVARFAEHYPMGG
ncbi:MAG: hypothetical protein CRN43_13365, partial [Candidatus Nephrothrix sp. EaCA]